MNFKLIFVVDFFTVKKYAIYADAKNGSAL